VLRTTSPVGTELFLPESVAEDRPYFTLDSLDQASQYYQSEGYVVVRGLVSAALCDAVVHAFKSCARASRVPILRQKNMRYEVNSFDANELLANPIFNIQDLQSKHFGTFKSAALNVFTDHGVTRSAAAVLGAESPEEGVRLVESMYFEAPAGTWPHQDSYYQDSAAKIGGATAAWFALEDITSKAGRFYVCPRSHAQFPVIWNRGVVNVGTGHEEYRNTILDRALEHGVEWRAPYMARGDVLFWNSLTIHGSLPGFPGSPDSRKSLTGHYLRGSDDLWQFHSRVRRQSIHRYNGCEVGRLHDQDRIYNQIVRTIAHRFPNAWGVARKVAIKAVIAVRFNEGRSQSPSPPPKVQRDVESS
jgi:phytanoyl-CoA hydroxylase